MIKADVEKLALRWGEGGWRGRLLGAAGGRQGERQSAPGGTFQKGASRERGTEAV